VVGDGPDLRRLRRAAGPTIRFAGRQPDASVAEIVSGARALVVTSVEEFGIAAVESQAAGRPVIARQGGGALETVVGGVTGCFWSGGASELAAAVERFDDAAVDPEACRRSAGRFDTSNFERGILREVRTAFEPGSGEASDRRSLRTMPASRRRVPGNHTD
jgi:glycosyltransferase involved in cell wall biosynthesis